MTVDALVSWVKDPEARKVYREALGRSSMEGMLNYYKANYPRDSAVAGDRLARGRGRAIPLPSRQVSGPLDPRPEGPGPAARALNDTWNWIDSDLTLVTIPGAGHFVQQDAADLVTRTMTSWLRR